MKAYKIKIVNKYKRKKLLLKRDKKYQNYKKAKSPDKNKKKIMNCLNIIRNYFGKNNIKSLKSTEKIEMMEYLKSLFDDGKKFNNYLNPNKGINMKNDKIIKKLIIGKECKIIKNRKQPF